MSKPTVPGHPRVAVAYLRASTDQQRLSPEAQRAGIQAWAVREDARVAAWYANLGVCSVAPVADRPALQATLGALRRHRAGLLVVAKRDRVARDVVLAAEVERARNARAPAW
jgi:DNA invertase Pin-like site-specific DNA recombinase